MTHRSCAGSSVVDLSYSTAHATNDCLASWALCGAYMVRVNPPVSLTLSGSDLGSILLQTLTHSFVMCGSCYRNVWLMRDHNMYGMEDSPKLRTLHRH
jgi:hypothetical protein